MESVWCGILVLQTLFHLAGAERSGIVHGQISKPHSRPYMVSLQAGGEHVCGGILIRNNFVLTVAHCQRSSSEKLMVVLGAHNIKREEKTQQRIGVAASYPHPHYASSDAYINDIMLLKLEKKATITKAVKVINLPNKKQKSSFEGWCSVTGWGRIAHNEKLSTVLRETLEKIEPSDVCKCKWQNYFHQEQMICSAPKEQGAGVCQGDSGGPIICKGLPLGLVIYTSPEDCSDPMYPHTFSKISYFLPWIKSTMKKAEDKP